MKAVFEFFLTLGYGGTKKD